MSSTTTRRQVSRLPRERRVAEIMAAARSVFCEKGYDDAPLSEIAERANVVEGSIYRYFENKRDLLIKVIEDWYEAMLADYDQQLSGITGTRNRLRFMIWRHLTTIHDEPALCNLMFQFLRTGQDYSQTAVFELNRRYTRRTLGIVEEGIAANELRSDVSLPLVRDMIYGCIEHRTWAYLRGEGDFNPDETADEIVELILTGLQKRLPQRTALTQEIADRLERVAERFETIHGEMSSRRRI